MLHNLPFDGISVVIPAYNEEIRIRASILTVIDELPTLAQGHEWEVLVADDGSTDSTAEVVRTLNADEPRVQLLSLLHRGKGAAVREGMLAARGQYILFSDADLATPIPEAEKLFHFLREGVDVAIGSRAAVGAQRLNEPFYREAMGYVFHYTVQLLLMHQFTDTQCGFKAFRRQTARDIFSRLALYNDNSPVITHPAVTGFDLEVLYLAVHLGYVVQEVPVEWHYRSGSKVSPLRDSFALLRDVLRVRSNARRHLYETDYLSLPPDSGTQRADGAPVIKDDPHVTG